jgi:hypothetical protein
MISLRFVCLTCAALGGVSTSAVAQDEHVEITVIAGQLRAQGFVCANPASADRLAKKSVPGKPVYLLKCENAVYEVRLIPNQAAEVTKLNSPSTSEQEP